MKTDKELGEIGAAAALLKQREQLTGNLCIVPEYAMWQADESARTAFAAAVRKIVREEIFAGVEGMPSEGVCLETYGLEISRNGYICGVNAVRKLMLAAFAKQIDRIEKDRDAEYARLNGNCKAMDQTIGELEAKLKTGASRFDSMERALKGTASTRDENYAKLAEAEKNIEELKHQIVDAIAHKSTKASVMEAQLAAAEKRLGEIAKLPEKWAFSTKPGSTYYANQLEQALKPTPTSEEIERAEFEAAYREEWERCEGRESEWKFDLRIFARDEQGRYVAQGVEPSWRMWKKASASKEVES